MRLIINIDNHNMLPYNNYRSVLPSDKIINVKLPVFLDTYENILRYIFSTTSTIFFNFNTTQLPVPLGELRYRLYANLDLFFMPELMKAVSEALSYEFNSVQDIKDTQESCYVVAFLISNNWSVTMTNLFVDWLYSKGMTAVEAFETMRPPYFTLKEDEEFDYLFFLDIKPTNYYKEII